MIEWVLSAGARNPENSLKVSWYTYYYDLNILSKRTRLHRIDSGNDILRESRLRSGINWPPTTGRRNGLKHAFKIYILKQTNNNGNPSLKGEHSKLVFNGKAKDATKSCRRTSLTVDGSFGMELNRI